MAVSYTTLIGSKATPGSILNWTNIVRVDPATCVAMAEDIIFAGYLGPGGRSSALRVREMRTSTEFTVAAAASTYALPTRFLDPITLYDRTNSGWIGPVHEEALIGHRSYDENGDIEAGYPSYYAIFNELLQFDVAFEEDAEMTFLHYARPAPLSGDNPTNWLTNRYGRILFLASCAMAYEFDDDQQNFAKCMGQVFNAITAANAESDLSRRGMLIDREIP